MGGVARAKGLSGVRRSQIASHAATRRWQLELEKIEAGPSITFNATKYQKERANQLVNLHLKKGLLKRPDACERCGKKGGLGEPCAHHDDYSKPIDVSWLCKVCHGRRHVELGWGSFLCKKIIYQALLISMAAGLTVKTLSKFIPIIRKAAKGDDIYNDIFTLNPSSIQEALKLNPVKIGRYSQYGEAFEEAKAGSSSRGKVIEKKFESQPSVN